MRKGQVVDRIVSVIGLLVGIILLCIGIGIENYKRGQVDCLSGIIKYELKQQANGDSKWVEKK